MSSIGCFVRQNTRSRVAEPVTLLHVVKIFGPDFAPRPGCPETPIGPSDLRKQAGCQGCPQPYPQVRGDKQASRAGISHTHQGYLVPKHEEPSRGTFTTLRTLAFTLLPGSCEL